jgi:histidyl-tRNA synthetase
MSDEKSFRPKARLPRGFRDRGPAEIAAERRMLDTIRGVYESFGFDPLDTPLLEYADALGKFLPDQDRPNEGVFSFQDDDGQWLSLRYDLTAPLARYVAENQQNLPKPFRRYQIGTNFRNEKPGPGRFREFVQCDADTVGSASPSADAEMLMMFADALDAVGLKRTEFAIKMSSRKLLDGVLEAAGLSVAGEDARRRRGIVLRAIDKLDRLGTGGIRALLGAGRKDESGDFTKGAELSPDQIARVIAFVAPENAGNDPDSMLSSIATAVKGSAVGEEGVADLSAIWKILSSCGYDDRVRFDTGIVRGLDYYTGTVFEAQLSIPVRNEAGESVVFGSVGGGGRYDDLIARFTGTRVPSVGFSIGVSRLASALRTAEDAVRPLVVVLVLDKSDVAASFRMVGELRAAGIRAEAYVGDAGMKAQLKYADRRNAAIAVIEGGDERAKGEVTLKDLALGAELAKSVESRAAWVGERAAQTSVRRVELVDEVRKLLARKG